MRYDFHCPTCESDFEDWAKPSEIIKICPYCGRTAKRKFGKVRRTAYQKKRSVLPTHRNFQKPTGQELGWVDFAKLRHKKGNLFIVWQGITPSIT